MRILLVTNGLAYGGAERILEALAIDLTAAGETVRVVATTRDGPIGDALRAHQIKVDVLGLRSPIDARAVIKLTRLIGAFRPAIIHSHLAVADIAVALAPVGTPRVTTVHNSGIELDAIKRSAWHVALKRFDKVLPVGAHVGKALDPSLPIQVVHPSLIAEKPLDRWAARARLGIPPEVPLVLAVGRLAPVKGFDILALARPLLTTPGARVAVIGEGPSPPQGLELLGPRDDAAEVIGAADVVVCPSRSEGFPQVPLQAMAAGVPVVATRVGGTPEIVADGVTGLLVPSEDPAALAGALDRLLGDRNLARALGEAGRRRLDEAGLLRARMIAAYRSVYAEIRR